jgi:hypothetical protein
VLATALSIHLFKTGEGLLHACISSLNMLWLSIEHFTNSFHNQRNQIWKAIWWKIQALKFYRFQQTPININFLFIIHSTNRINVNINSVPNSTIQKAFYINTDFCFTTAVHFCFTTAEATAVRLVVQDQP